MAKTIRQFNPSRKDLVIPTHPDQYIDVQTLSFVLDIAVSTAWSWVQQKRLPEPKRWGARCSRWRWGDILEAIERL